MRFATNVGAYEIDSVPSQPQVAHCHGFFVRADLRGRGFAHQLKTDQNITLIALKYDYAMCTVCSNNIAQKRVLEGAGWSRTGEFMSSKSGAAVEVWGWEVQKARYGHG